MRIYNLTDLPLPKQSKTNPIILKKHGITIKPGEYMDVPDTFALGSISGWMSAGWASVNARPDWYLAAREAARNKIAADKSASRKTKKEVVEAAEETKVADVTEIRPKKKRKKKGDEK